MKGVFKVAAEVLRSKLEKDSPTDAGILETVDADDVLVLYGSMDQVQDVLETAGIPHRLIHSLDEAELSPHQLLIINCPGEVSDASIEKIRAFVHSGGNLVTTDWALHNVIERAFPGYVEWNSESTGDEVVGVRVIDSSHPFVAGIMSDKGEPQWWLEGGSYPIKVLNRDEVSVLVDSPELGKRYAESPVAILFHFGHGEVFHMLSHYYLQRTELKTTRHSTGADIFVFDEMGLTSHDIDEKKLAGITLGEIESAYSSAKLISNIVIDKKRKSLAHDGETERVLADMAGEHDRSASSGRIKLVDESDKPKRIKLHDEEKGAKVRTSPRE